jgi:hypothetical protein
MDTIVSNWPNILLLTFVIVAYFGLRAIGKKKGVG